MLQQLSVLHYMNNLLISNLYFMQSSTMFLLFKNYSPVEVTYFFWLDSIRISYSKETHRILIEMKQINNILTHANQTQRSYWKGLVIMKINDTPYLNTASYFTNLSLSINLWESIEELWEKLNRFWIDLLLSFTIGMTYMSMQQSCSSLKKPNFFLNYK